MCMEIMLLCEKDKNWYSISHSYHFSNSQPIFYWLDYLVNFSFFSQDPYETIKLKFATTVFMHTASYTSSLHYDCTLYTAFLQRYYANTHVFDAPNKHSIVWSQNNSTSSIVFYNFRHPFPLNFQTH